MSFNLIIRGNYIGTNATGTASLPNIQGILVAGPGVIIGGALPGEGNVISGNPNVGISIFSNALGSIVRGNKIGTNAAGTAGLPNRIGIAISGNLSTIGGTQPGESNLIAFNLEIGVVIFPSATRASIRGNSIHSNVEAGIDSDLRGVNANDAGDADTGGNSRQNYPMLTTANASPANIFINGTLNSKPSSSFTLEFFSSPSCDASGHGEGQTFLGSNNVSTDTGGITGFNVNLPLSTTIGLFVTTTATDAEGNTSEFSQCRVIASNSFSISGRAIDNNNVPLTSNLIQLSGGQTTSTSSDNNGNYVFNNLPGGSNYTVSISRVNYDFAQPNRSYTNLAANQTNQNFVGTKTRFTIAGLINASIQGTLFPLSSVNVTLSGAAARTTTANAIYSFNDLTPGSYVVTPGKDGFAFTPANVNISNSDQPLSFTAIPSSPLPGRIIFTQEVRSLNADGSACHPSLVTANVGGLSLSRDGK